MNNPASHYLQEAFRLGLELEKFPKDFPIVPDIAAEALNAAETATLYARECYEPYCRQTKNAASETAQIQTGDVTGTVALSGDGWLMVRMNTRLSNSRRPSTGYLESTLLRLLKGYREAKGILPWYSRAFVAITEHSRRERGNVFDPDNKDWKGVTNALKGAVFEDDDQFTISLILDAVWDDEAFCEITVLPYEDAPLYFMRRGKPGESAR